MTSFTCTVCNQPHTLKGTGLGELNMPEQPGAELRYLVSRYVHYVREDLTHPDPDAVEIAETISWIRGFIRDGVFDERIN